MPTITIRRKGGWTDRLRSYSVTIDGVERGAVRANGVERFEVPAGPHEIQLWTGPIYSSPMLTVDVGDGGVTLACGSNAIPGLAFLSLAKPNRWIALAQVDSVEVGTAPRS